MCWTPPLCHYNRVVKGKDPMSLMVPQFSRFLATVPQFILENDANWNDLVKYVFQEYKQPTMGEYAILERVYDNTIAVSLN